MKNKTILIIDDDFAILDSIKAVLEISGYSVITAQTSEDGLGAFKNEKPDFILCDMMMESIDEGVKIIKIIRETDEKTPVFLMSSIGDAVADNINIDELGFNGIFQKPVNLEKMLALIEKSLK